MIDLFYIDHASPSWPMNRWVTAMMRLFKPQIIELLLERDRTVEDWQKRDPDGNVYENRELDITSHCRISVKEQIGQVNAALQCAEGGVERRWAS